MPPIDDGDDDELDLAPAKGKGKGKGKALADGKGKGKGKALADGKGKGKGKDGGKAGGKSGKGDGKGKGKAGKSKGGRGLEGKTLTGTIKSFNQQRGWGFAWSDSLLSRDIFVHAKEFDESVKEIWPGDEIEFELSHTESGDPRAVWVRWPSEGWYEDEYWGESWTDDSWWGSGGYNDYGKGGGGKGGGKSDYGKGGGKGGGTMSGPPGGAGSSGVRVRISNFPWTLTWQKLREAFEACGEISFVEMDDNQVGQAVVTFRRPEAARKAVEEYHHGNLNGRKILVHYEY